MRLLPCEVSYHVNALFGNQATCDPCLQRLYGDNLFWKSQRLALLDEALAFHTKKARDTSDVRDTIVRAFANDPVDIALYQDDLGEEGWPLFFRALADGPLAATGLWLYACKIGDSNVDGLLAAADAAGAHLKNINVGKCDLTAEAAAKIAAWKAESAHGSGCTLYVMNQGPAWGEEGAECFVGLENVVIDDFEDHGPTVTPVVGGRGGAIFRGKLGQAFTITAVSEDGKIDVVYDDGSEREGLTPITGMLHEVYEEEEDY